MFMKFLETGLTLSRSLTPLMMINILGTCSSGKEVLITYYRSGIFFENWQPVWSPPHWATKKSCLSYDFVMEYMQKASYKR